MTDPLSVASGIITCIGAAVATAKAIDQAKQMIKLPDHFNSLFEEVSDLQTTLQQCSMLDVFGANGAITDQDTPQLLGLYEYVRKAQTKLVELEGLVRKHCEAVGFKSHEQLKAIWFVVVKGKSRLQAFKDDLRTIRNKLYTAFSIFTATAMKTMQTTVNGIATNTTKIASNQEQLMHVIYAWHQANILRRSTTSQPQFTLPSYEETSDVDSSGLQSEHIYMTNALDYLHSFKPRYAGDEILAEKFALVHNDFTSNTISPQAASARIAALFKSYPDLLKGYNSFLPPPTRAAVSEDTHSSTSTLALAPPPRPNSLTSPSRPSSSCSISSVSSFSTPESRLSHSRRLFKSAYTDAGTCVPWCSCACHAPTSLYSPRALQALLGTLNATHSGLPYLTAPCNEPSCAARAQPRFRLSYKPPRALAQHMLALSLSAASLAGPEVKVRLPRVVGWNSPLWLYAREGNINAVLALFSAGLASPWDVNAFGANLLTYATQTWNPELARRLLAAGVDPSIEDDFRSSAAMYAWDRVLAGKLSGEDADMVATLFADADYISSCAFSPVHKALFGMVDVPLSQLLAASTRDLDAPDARGRTPLIWASARGDEAAVALLLSSGADPSLRDWRQETALHHARTAAVADLLVAAGADIYAQNMDAQTPLYRAAKKNTSPALVRFLLAAGCGVNVQDRARQTPLDGACSTTWHAGVVHALLAAGADVNVRNDSADTAVRFALIYNAHDILRSMLSPALHADFSGTNTYGQTFAHAIARTADIETLTILTNAAPRSLRLDLTARDASGKTCMHYLDERLAYLSETAALREAWCALAAALEENTLPLDRGKILGISERLGVCPRTGVALEGVEEVGSDVEEEFEDARE